MGNKLDHYPVPASGAPVWGHCSGSIIASQAAPDTWSRESDEGEAAHWVGSETLEMWKAGNPADCAYFLGDTAPNGVVIDEKMVEGAQVYVDDVVAVAERYEVRAELLVEQRVEMPQIHANNGGTLDAALVLVGGTSHGRDFMTWYLWDYKHGHRMRTAKENLQLIDYVAGLSSRLNVNGAQDQHVTVHMRIVQPFAYRREGPVDEWVVTLSDLRGHFNQLHNQAAQAYTDPRMTPGAHCRDCPAVDRCDAAKQYLYAWADYANSPYVIDTLTGRQLATERALLTDALAVMKSRLESIEDDLEHRIAAGEADTGLTLESTEGHLAWTVPPAQAVALAQQFGVDINKPGVKTPAQAIQAVPTSLRAAFTSVLTQFAKRPAGKMKLVPADSSKAARAFTKNTGA